MPQQSSAGAQVFEQAISWLRDNYGEFSFHVERDIVWTLQGWLVKAIQEQGLPYKVFHDYPILPGTRRSLSADLAILKGDLIEAAAEFKYEPDHSREDIQRQKLPRVFWGTAPSEAGTGVAHDVERARQFVEVGRAKVAYAVFIDEGGYWRHKEPIPGSEWLDWNGRVFVLWSRWPRK